MWEFPRTSRSLAMGFQGWCGEEELWGQDSLVLVMALQQGYTLAKQLQSLVDSDRTAEAQKVLEDLKVLLTGFESLPPLNRRTPQARDEQALGRQVLELAVFLSVKLQDKVGFQRHMAQLKPYYQDLRGQLPESERRAPIMGLYLLFLLFENRLAELHSELELLSEEERNNPYISFPIQLEQALMVGNYDKVLNMRTHMPHPSFGYFISLLTDTIRDAVAECSEVAYTKLGVNFAKQSMLLDSDDALARYAQEKHRDWQIKDKTIYFGKNSEEKHARASDVPSLRLISETLSYATELERIV